VVSNVFGGGWLDSRLGFKDQFVLSVRLLRCLTELISNESFACTLCMCEDVSVSSLNDGFFLLHTDTADNSGKVQHTYLHTHTHAHTHRQTDRQIDVRLDGDVIVIASLFRSRHIAVNSG